MPATTGSYALRTTLTLVVLFWFAPVTAAAPRYQVLHAFTNGNDGADPAGSLTLDQQGNVYGATVAGTIFELSPQPTGPWIFQVIFTFNGVDGSTPNGGMVLDAVGNLYGKTLLCCPYPYGEAFELSPGSEGWTENTIYNFGDPVGASPGGLIIDSAGNLFGAGRSTFELSPAGEHWNLTVLHTFPSYRQDGTDPYAVVMDAAGNLYGTTTHGGNLGRCGGGCGTVYELSPTANGDWEEHVLHRFGGVYDGAFPEDESLVVDKTGAVYGTTDVGGRRGYGTVFKLSRKAGRWKETILHNFANDTGGSNPAAGVVMDKSGNLYGTTVGGGDPNCGCGVMYKLAPRPHGKWKYAVLHTFVGSDGAEPAANLILDSKGNLYGTAQLGGSGHNGVAFELTP